MISKIRDLANNPAWVERLRFLIVGGVNTVFGYAFSLTFYYQVEGALPTPLILVINTLVSITFSFVLYKVFVFRTKGNWLTEYLRSYVVYGASSFVGIIITWILVDFFDFEFWIVQSALLVFVVMTSYFGHRNFTFKVKAKNNG